MKFTVNIKGTPSPKNSQLVKLELIFYKRHYPRVPKVLDITGPLKEWNQKNQCFDGRSSEIKAKNQKLLDLVTQYTGIAAGWNKEGVEWAPAHSIMPGKPVCRAPIWTSSTASNRRCVIWRNSPKPCRIG